MGSAARKEGDTIANLDANWQARKAYFGLDPEYANSPYSQASLLQRSRQIGQRATLNSAGRRLYSGATRARQGVIDRNYGEDYTRLREQHDAEERSYSQERAQAVRQREEEEEEARLEAAERAAEVEPDASAAPAEGGGGGGGGSGRKKAKVRPKANQGAQGGGGAIGGRQGAGGKKGRR